MFSQSVKCELNIVIPHACELRMHEEGRDL
jgi:hypothetical protein